jgi:hypothetical protein
MNAQMPFGVHGRRRPKTRCLKVFDCLGGGAIPGTESCPLVAQARPNGLCCYTSPEYVEGVAIGRGCIGAVGAIAATQVTDPARYT